MWGKQSCLRAGISWLLSISSASEVQRFVSTPVSPGHNIDELIRNYHDLSDLFAFEVGLNFGVGAGQALDLLARGSVRHGQPAAKLAVYLHRDLDLVLDGQLGIVARPFH